MSAEGVGVDPIQVEEIAAIIAEQFATLVDRDALMLPQRFEKTCEAAARALIDAGRCEQLPRDLNSFALREIAARVRQCCKFAKVPAVDADDLEAWADALDAQSTAAVLGVQVPPQ